MTTATPATLSATLAAALPGDVIQLQTGNYAGKFDLKTPGVTIEPAPGAFPTFTGPAAFTTSKVAWLHIWASAKGATVRNIAFVRDGDIAAFWKAGWNDYGIIVEAPDVRIENCTLAGMAKGIHVKSKTSTGCTIVHNTIGPTIDSCIAIATSYGVVRGMLIGWNLLRDSLREDAVQFMPNFDLSAADEVTDVSNLGTILYENTVEGCNENAYDMKGAGQIIIHGGTVRRVGGYSNGYPFDPKLHYGPCIMHGARTSTGLVIVRNVDIQVCGGGIKLFPHWHVHHNTLEDNNFDPAGRSWDGTGISQPGATPGAALKNNLSSGHKAANYSLSSPTADFERNPTDPGPGVALTRTKGNGSGRVVTLEDAGYFTDWFGRKDLPAEVIYLDGQRYEVQTVDYGANTIRLDQNTTWQDGQPVFWFSPQPTVGCLQSGEIPPPPPPPPPPPTEPPAEVVRLVLESTLPPAEAAQLRALLAGREVKVTLV